MIRLLASGFNVQPLVDQLAAHPELWNEHRHRLQGPHSVVSDIWVRFNPIENFDPENPAAFLEPHEPAWYPCIEKIPAAKQLCEEIEKETGENDLLGVLITRIPAGGEVGAHTDSGWHAEVTNKYAVQLAGNFEQSFYVEGQELRTKTGDIFTFDNSKTHGVRNPSNEDRMTFIACYRRSS